MQQDVSDSKFNVLSIIKDLGNHLVQTSYFTNGKTEIQKKQQFF